MSIFSREKIVNSCPNAVKWLYLLCNLEKFSGGACPRTPLEKFRLCPSPRKILLFHKISMEALGSLAQVGSIPLWSRNWQMPILSSTRCHCFLLFFFFYIQLRLIFSLNQKGIRSCLGNFFSSCVSAVTIATAPTAMF